MELPSGMALDIVLQALLILGGISFFLFMNDVPKKLLTKFKLYRNRSKFQARSHFVQGAQLLAQARSRKSTVLAEKSVSEAEKAISLDPTDAAAHILKALALDFQGFKTSALDSINIALSSLAVKSLSKSERGDALYRRGELKFRMMMGDRVEERVARVDSVINDLAEAVKCSEENPGEGLRLLGECYEIKGMKEEAKEAYEEAIKAKPELESSIREKLERVI